MRKEADHLEEFNAAFELKCKTQAVASFAQSQVWRQ